MERLNLFSTPIFFKKNFTTDEERLSIVSHIKANSKLFDKIGNVEGVGYGNFRITHYKTNNINNFFEGNNIINYFVKTLPKCFNLKNKIEQTINELTPFFGFNKVDIDNSWITIQKKESSLLRHSHSLSKLSVILYLNVGDKASDLFFYNPNPNYKFMEYDIYDHTNFSSFQVTPENNLLLIFPGWLEHGSDIVPNEFEDRIALSINTK
jgi:hypothetical protein